MKMILHAVTSLETELSTLRSLSAWFDNAHEALEQADLDATSGAIETLLSYEMQKHIDIAQLACKVAQKLVQKEIARLEPTP